MYGKVFIEGGPWLQWRRVSSGVSFSDGVQLGGEVLIIKYH